MPLTARQQEALDSLDWLYSEEERSLGRTIVQAVAYVRVAARTPGFHIRVQDHSCMGHRADRMLLGVIQGLMLDDPEMAPYFVQDLRAGTFCFSAEMPPTDWMPASDALGELPLRTPLREMRPNPLPLRRVNVSAGQAVRVNPRPQRTPPEVPRIYLPLPSPRIDFWETLASI